MDTPVTKLTEARVQRQVDLNLPGKETVLARLKHAIEDIESGKMDPQKCALVFLDDREGSYNVSLYGAGVKPAEASFLCDYAHDLFKDFIS